jgi:hypothetical protein
MDVILAHPYGLVNELLLPNAASHRPCQNDMRPLLAPRNHPSRPNMHLTQLSIHQHVASIQKPFGTLFA